jgi:hypothetical protein
LRLDEITQQNSALVEEATAAADSMRSQAVKLSHAVAAFKIDHQGAHDQAQAVLIQRVGDSSIHDVDEAHSSRPQRA